VELKIKTWWRVFLLVACIWGGTTVPVASGPDGPLARRVSTPPPGLRLLRADRFGLVLEWVAPPVEVRSLDDGTVEVVAEGYARTEQPGVPLLPFTATLIALPPGASPHLRVLSAEETTCPLAGPLAIAPRPKGVARDERGRPIGGAFAPASWESQTPIASPVILEEIGVVRGVRLARLTFYPTLPEGDILHVIQRLRVEVSWEARAHPAGDGSDLILDRVRQAVLNPRDAVVDPRPVAPAAFQPAGGGAPTAFIEVAPAGLYHVTYEDLESLGFGRADPQNLRLFRGDDEVACEWEGDDDATFEPGEALLFYAEPRFSRWTDVDVYRLVADVSPGLRMAARSGDPTGLPAGVAWTDGGHEANYLYTPDCFCAPIPPGRDGDRWVWDALHRPDRATGSYIAKLDGVNATHPATLTLWLIGYTDVAANPDHCLDVAFNDTSLGRVEWDGKAAITATLPISASILSSGVNTLTLSLPGIPGAFPEGAWLDAFAVHYARSAASAGVTVHFTGENGRYVYTVTLDSPGPYRAYDVTDPLRPQRLTGVPEDSNPITLGDPPDGGPRRYVVFGANGVLRPVRIRPQEDPWGFHATGGFTGANVLIITHPAFAEALGPLVDLRQSQGLSTVVANVLGIYDAYGDGRPDPEAIRAFIADAYATWDPRPSYVLLVGDGSFNPRGYGQTIPPPLDVFPDAIPPYLADVDPWAGETAADNRYVCVDGDDTLPDLLLGRLPVQTAEEAQTVVGKIVAYETNPFPGGWNADVLLVADDADAAGNFAASSDAHAAAYVTSPFTVTRHYCEGDSPDKSDCPAQGADALHASLLNDWNQGALLVQFTGHSSWQQWAAERFFHLDDLSSLRNDRRLPVAVEMTCFTGAFQRPEPTLDEELVTLSGGGAVAAWGPTGLGVGTGHGHLSAGFFRAVFTDQVETMGEATLVGKWTLASSGQSLDLLDTFNLLGDPALRLDRTIVPWAHEAFLPLVLRGK